MLNAIVPYYGGKRSLAPEIVSELGDHRAYFEPFCGGMSVLMAKPRSRQETVCDMNGQLMNLAMVMRCPRYGPRLYRRLRRVLSSEPEYLAAYASSDTTGTHTCDFGELSLEKAFNYFIKSWLGRNGLVGSAKAGKSFCVRYTPGGGSTATRWKHAVNSIPAFRRRLRDVTILCRDAFDVIASIQDVPGVAIYCDPPYLEKSGKYIHDFSWEDHGRLAELLRRFRHARVVVSYYDHPRLCTLYPCWEKRTFQRHKNLSNQGQYEFAGTKCTEILLLNGPSLCQQLDVVVTREYQVELSSPAIGIQNVVYQCDSLDEAREEARAWQKLQVIDSVLVCRNGQTVEEFPPAKKGVS